MAHKGAVVEIVKVDMKKCDLSVIWLKSCRNKEIEFMYLNPNILEQGFDDNNNHSNLSIIKRHI